MSSKLDYLKRYMSKDTDKAKNKRQKHKKERTGNGVRVVDEDVSWEEIAPKNDKAEEKWQLDDERPVIVNGHEEYPSDLPVVLNADEFNQELEASNKSVAKVDDDYSPPRKARRSREESKTTRSRGHGDDSDTSPPRKRRSESMKEDASPPRKSRKKLHRRNDTDPVTRRLHERNISLTDERDASPLRRDNSTRDPGDASPPRRCRIAESVEDKAPPRRLLPSGSSEHKEEKSSPPRRRKETSSSRRHVSRERHENMSVSRSRSHESHRRSARRSRDRSERIDSGPDKPRSPRHRSQDSSRRRSRSDVRARRAQRTRSASRESHKEKVEKMDTVKKQTTTAAASTATLEEKPKEKRSKAGLYTADQFVAEQERIARAKDMLQGADPSQMGANAETVYRDKRGRKMDMLNEMIRQQEILEGKRKRKAKEEYEWGTGQVQKEEKRSQQELLEEMKSKPFARHEDDEELEKLRRERKRDFDPMNSKMFQATNDDLLGRKSRKKKKTKNKSKDKKNNSKPKYSGPPAPPNRFGIQPGYRWDGVVRGNGWEEKILLKQNARTAQSEEQYKYAVADM